MALSLITNNNPKTYPNPIQLLYASFDHHPMVFKLITPLTLPVPEIDLSLILILLKTITSFQNDTDIEAQIEPASVNIIN